MTRLFLLPAYCFLIVGSLFGGAFSARAQSPFEPAVLENFKTDAGRCTRVDGTKYEGKMQYEFGGTPHLVIWPNGERTKLFPESVMSFSIDNRFFISTDWEGHVPTQDPAADYDGTFVQLVDTGRLELARLYTLQVDIPRDVSKPIMPHERLVIASPEISLLLRQRKGEWVGVTRPAMGGYTSKKFRAMLAHYLADRPDLLKSLNNEALLYHHVEQAIRAYNSGEPTFFIE